METITRSSTSAQVRVLEPHRANLPPVADYFRRVRHYRAFAVELAKGKQRASNSATVFGQLWQILNPLLLAMVYYLVWGIIFSRGASGRVEGADYAIPQTSFLTYLIGGLFVYYYTNRALNQSVNSLTSQASLMQNTSFPRMVLPLSSNIAAFLNFMPMLLVYLGFHLGGGFPLHWTMLLVALLVVIQSVMNLGLSLILATMNVYFRDTGSFLPYFLRIWLYLSPIIYVKELVPERFAFMLPLNPLVPILDLWNSLVNGLVPSMGTWLAASAWAGGLFLVGTLVFMSRESEFAVRL